MVKQFDNVLYTLFQTGDAGEWGVIYCTRAGTSSCEVALLKDNESLVVSEGFICREGCAGALGTG